MRLDQATLDAILNRRVKLRQLRVPVEHGRHGELLRPFRPERVYTLTGPHPYTQLRERAPEQATRAAAVLWLIEEATRQEVTRQQITVLAVTLMDDPSRPAWRVEFALGDVSDLFDKPRLLAVASGPSPQTCKCGHRITGLPPDAQRCPACGRDLPKDREDDHGYTRESRRALPAEPEAVTRAEQDRITQDAHDRQSAAKRAEWRLQRVRVGVVIAGMREHDLGSAEIDVKALEHRLEQLDWLLLSLKQPRAQAAAAAGTDAHAEWRRQRPRLQAVINGMRGHDLTAGENEQMKAFANRLIRLDLQFPPTLEDAA